jgi:hypothetical protein
MVKEAAISPPSASSLTKLPLTADAKKQPPNGARAAVVAGTSPPTN